MSNGGGCGVRMVIVGDIVGGVIEVRYVEWAGKSSTRRDGAGILAHVCDSTKQWVDLRLASLTRFSRVRNSLRAADDE